MLDGWVEIENSMIIAKGHAGGGLSADAHRLRLLKQGITFYISPLYFFCTYFTHNVSYAIPTSIVDDIHFANGNQETTHMPCGD